MREQRTPVLSGPLYWLLQSSVLTSTDLCLLSSPCHQKSHDERAVFLYGTSIHFFRNEPGIAYFFGSERGIVRRFQRLFGDFVLISFRSYNGILTHVVYPRQCRARGCLPAYRPLGHLLCQARPCGPNHPLNRPSARMLQRAERTVHRHRFRAKTGMG